MEISERKKKILAAVVDEYILTAEPVGSKALAEKAGLGCSSATIRNELAEDIWNSHIPQPAEFRRLSDTECMSTS